MASERGAIHVKELLAMKAGRTLQSWATELDRRAKASRDFIAPTDRLRVSTPSEGTGITTMAIPTSDEPETFAIQPMAHGQIANRLKVPKPYYERIREDHPRLYDDTVNTLLHAEPTPRMVRTLDGGVRAFLSNRYRPIDNGMVAESVMPVLNDQPDMNIISCEVTDRRMYLKALFPKPEAEVKRGDVVQAGLCITNSEVGAGRYEVQLLIYRLICLNGMISQDNSFKKTHLGRALGDGENASEFFRDATLEADDRALMMKMQDVVRGFLTADRFAGVVKQLQGAAEDKIEGNPVKAVEELAKRFTLNEDESGGVLRHLIEGGDLSRYGVMNAVTRTSQDVDDYDRATELEQMGGQVIELPRTDWTAIADRN